MANDYNPETSRRDLLRGLLSATTAFTLAKLTGCAGQAPRDALDVDVRRALMEKYGGELTEVMFRNAARAAQSTVSAYGSKGVVLAADPSVLVDWAELVKSDKPLVLLPGNTTPHLGKSGFVHHKDHFEFNTTGRLPGRDEVYVATVRSELAVVKAGRTLEGISKLHFGAYDLGYVTVHYRPVTSRTLDILAHKAPEEHAAILAHLPVEAVLVYESTKGFYGPSVELLMAGWLKDHAAAERVSQKILNPFDSKLTKLVVANPQKELEDLVAGLDVTEAPEPDAADKTHAVKLVFKEGEVLYHEPGTDPDGLGVLARVAYETPKSGKRIFTVVTKPLFVTTLPATTGFPTATAVYLNGATPYWQNVTEDPNGLTTRASTPITPGDHELAKKGLAETIEKRRKQFLDAKAAKEPKDTAPVGSATPASNPASGPTK